MRRALCPIALAAMAACQLSEYSPPVQRLTFDDGGASGGDSTAGDPTAGDPTAGDPTAGDPTAGDPTAGDPTPVTGSPCNDIGECPPDHDCIGNFCLRDVGQPCANNGQCGLGFCADDICCNSACTGDCEACDGSGSCQMPADDPACGNIDCDGLDTTCRDFHNLTAARCLNQGQCKESGTRDCDQWTDQPATTTCDDSDACTDPDRCGGGRCNGDAICTDYTDVTTTTGVDTIDVSASAYTYGISWADIDNDGDLDLWLSRGADLFINNADGSFTKAVGGPWDDELYARAGMWADVDNDGDMDLTIRRTTTAGGHQLLINDGTGTFTNRGVAAGISDGFNPGVFLWIDYDHDGTMDLFQPESYDDPDNLAPANRMFSNNGDVPVTFALIADTTTGLSMPTPGAYSGEAATVADINNDGHPDIWYSDGTDGSLFMNDGDGTFTEDAAGAELAIDMGANQPYQPVLFADYDNDGWLDAFFGHPELIVNRLYHNDGDGTFTLTALLAEDLGDSIGAAWGDIDNDGDLDLLVVNDATVDVLYQNDGSTFTDIAVSLGIDGGATGASVGASLADYDNDGDLDILKTNVVEADNSMWQNGTNDGKYLKVIATGRGAGFASVDGIGSRIELWDAAATTLLAVRDVSGGEGLGNQRSRFVHFGLAAAWGGGHATYTVRVRFVDGTSAETTVIPTDASVTIGGNVVPQTVEIVQP